MLFRLMDLPESSSMCIMVIRPRCCIVSVNPTEKSARKIGTLQQNTPVARPLCPCLQSFRLLRVTNSGGIHVLETSFDHTTK